MFQQKLFSTIGKLKNGGSKGAAKIRSATPQNRPTGWSAKWLSGKKVTLNYILRFLIAALFGAARIFGAYAPFGIGFAASSGAGLRGLVAFAGVAIGAVVAGGFNWALKYAAIGILVLAASIIFRDREIYDKDWFAPLNVAVMTACVGFVYTSRAGWDLAPTAYFISEVILAAGCAYFYRGAEQSQLAAGRLRRNAAAYAVELSSNESASRKRVSILIFLATLFVPLAKLEFMDTVSVGRVAATILVMSMGFKGGMAWGCASGVTLGAAMDASHGGAPFFTTAYALSGLIGGIFGNRSRLAFAVTYILANAVAAMWQWTDVYRDPLLYETLAASVMFMLLPSTLLRSWKEQLLPPVTAGGGTAFAARFAKEKAEAAAAAFRDVYRILQGNVEGGHNDNDVASVFDVAADSVCRKCRRSAICWQSEYSDTRDIMNSVAALMQKRGEAVADDFPMRFRAACIELPGFINAVNAELRAVLIRRQYRNRMKEGRDTLFDRFRDMSDVLSSVAAAYPADIQDDRAERAEARVNLLLRGLELDVDCAAFTDKGGRIHFELSGGALSKLIKRDRWLEIISDAADCLLNPAEDNPNTSDTAEAIRLTEVSPLSASIGVASLRRRGEDVSGDNGSFFKTDDGTLCVILSDGMGSGDAAFRDSQAAVSVLERFLKAGVAPKTALRVLGAVMTLRGDESIGCATIDLLCVNLFSGVGELYKFGAAPSFVRKGAAVKRVSGDALSAGLGSNTPDCTHLQLDPGTFAVIISDGVAGDDDGWLSDAVARWDYRGDDFARSLARSLVEQAASKYGVDDDMTALVVKIA